MTPDEVISQAQDGTLAPVYLLLGEERFLRNQVIAALRALCLQGTIPGFNEDDFTAGEASVGTVVGTARTLPMMARRRWVLVRDLERWESKSAADDADTEAGDETASDKSASDKSANDKASGAKSGALDDLAAYATAASPSTVLVLCANKLNAKRRLVTLAKKQGFLVECQLLSKHELPGWIRSAAKRRGNPIDSSAAELIAAVAGPDLSALDDLLERLSLFVGESQPITEDSVGQLIPIVRPATVWQLVDAVGRRDRGLVLTLLARVYDPQDRGLRLLGVLAWSARQMVRFEAAMKQGLAGAAAAKAAGVPPFRARALEQQVRKLPPGFLETWLVRLRDVDFALKGGSKRPPQAILESALIDLCDSRRTG
jgi:DNA polymerase-3 subunit delta